MGGGGRLHADKREQPLPEIMGNAKTNDKRTSLPRRTHQAKERALKTLPYLEVFISIHHFMEFNKEKIFKVLKEERKKNHPLLPKAE